MLRSYLKSGLRNLSRSKLYSFINISGLSLGLTCSILIALWVIDEYEVDSFHDDLDRIFAVTSTEYVNGKITYGGYDTPGLLGEELPKVLPEVEYACNYSWGTFHTLSVGDKKTKTSGNFAGPDFFKIFSYPLIAGTKETALPTKESVAISRRLAIRFFGSPEMAIDKSLRFDNDRDLKITAVFEDHGDNVSDKFQYMLNWEFFLERGNWARDWHNSGPMAYVKLREHTNVESVLPKIRHFIKNYNKDYSDNERLELGLQPFGEKYLHSNFKNGIVDGGRIEYVRLFEAVSVFILLIACINFMNMSTARAVKRSKEIGVRKVIGAVRTALMTQFFLEAALFTMIAVAFSVVLLAILLPEFNLLTGKNIAMPFSSGRFWIGLATLTMITAMISGSYPALLLSSFKPITAIRNNVKIGGSSTLFRKGLVVFQFALSIIFIVGMIVISSQVDFIQNKNLGYEKNNLIYLRLEGQIASRFKVFKNEALQIQGVTGVSYMSQRPLTLENTTNDVGWEGKASDTKINFVEASVGYDFIDTMDATMLSGRDFSEDHADSASYIINEAALKVIGYKDPIGMPLTFWRVKGTIIGVVKNFHFNSLHVPIAPLVLRLRRMPVSGFALIRVEPDKTTAVLEDLEDLHKNMNPEFIYAYQIADEEYRALYESEQVAQQLSKYFAILSISISCLGLLGLVIFSAEQRTKEVGLRKVLGASVFQIIVLLSGDFMKLVILAITLSLPVSYYIMNEWLHGFEYNVGFQWWMFATAAVASISIALLTISTQALRAASANPVDSLKAE